MTWYNPNPFEIIFQGICDGAGAIVLASEEAVKANNLTPLAKLLGYHISGELVVCFSTEDLCEAQNLHIVNFSLLREINKKREPSNF